MHINKNSTAYIPIRKANGRLSPVIIHDYDSCLKKLLEELKDAIHFYDSYITVLTIKCVDIDDEKLKELKKSSSFIHPVTCDFLEINVDCKIDVEEVRSGNPQLKNDNDTEVVKYHSALSLHICLEKIWMLTELAYPGYFNILEGLVYEDDSPVIRVKENHSFSSLYYDNPESKKIWPIPKKIHLGKVQKWCSKLNFGERAIATSRLDRTLASFTNAVATSWTNEGELLFRCMQGLEAFYTNSTGDLRNQLSEKVKFFLAPPKKNIIQLVSFMILDRNLYTEVAI